jgi:hypothetical protein
MYIDAQNELSDAQAVTATAISENVIDMGVTGVKLGAGTPKFIEVAVDTLPVSAGSSTLVVTVESSDAVGLTSTNTHATSATIAKATLVAGYKIRLHLDPNVVMKRYLGLRYTVAVANFSAGNFSAYVAPVEQNADTYVGQT